MRTKYTTVFVLLLCSMMLIVSCAGQGNHNNFQEQADEDAHNVVAENDVFRLFAPKPQVLIETPAVAVSGEANISGSHFYWTLEDGHNILASGEITVEQHTWETFEFEVSFDHPSSPSLSLVLYTMAHGEIEKQLIVPMKASEAMIEKHS